MTSNKDVHVSGAAQDGTDLRRRNIPRQNGTLTPPQEEIDEKKSQKVRSMVDCILEWIR